MGLGNEVLMNLLYIFVRENLATINNLSSMSLNQPLHSSMLAIKLGVSNERARQLIKPVKEKLGYDVITIQDFLDNSNRKLSPLLFG